MNIFQKHVNPYHSHPAYFGSVQCSPDWHYSKRPNGSDPAPQVIKEDWYSHIRFPLKILRVPEKAWPEGKQNSKAGSTFHKPTWTRQYRNFRILHSVQCKRVLLQSLSTRARRICSSEKLGNVQRILCVGIEGLPKQIPRWVKRNAKEKIKIVDTPMKTVFISLPFKRDQSGSRTDWGLGRVVRRIYYAVTLVGLRNTKRMFSESILH